MKSTPFKSKRSARQDALFLLNKREYSFQELIDKLVQRGHTQDEALVASEEMRTKDFQNDKRYAKYLVNSKAAQKQSPRKIKALARQKGVDPSLCDEFLEQIDFFEPLKSTIFRRFGETPYAYEQKTKIYRFLLSKGYDYETAKSLLDEMAEESA